MPAQQLPIPALLARILLGLALLALGSLAARVLLRAISDVGYIHSLDYGEGIVLQQALLIAGPRAYGDITQFPFIVFHYPPVYLLAVNVLVSLGVDIAAAGRGISIAATLATSLAVAVMVYTVLMGKERRSVALFGAAAGGLVVFAFQPVSRWMPLARVDMLAVAFTVWGLVLVPHVVEARWKCYAAALLFTLAIFTKQMTVAAPLAATLVLFVVRPRDAARLVIAGLAFSLTIMAVATMLTEGRFLQHLIFYNINRYSRVGLWITYHFVVSDFALILLGSAGATAVLWHLIDFRDGKAVKDRLHGVSHRLRQDLPTRVLAVCFLYLSISTPLLALVLESGSNINYFLEWVCGCAVMIGVLAGWAARAASSRKGRMVGLSSLPTLLFSSVLLTHAAMHTPSAFWSIPERPTTRDEMQGVVSFIRVTTKPVLSDDMLLLLRAGKEVSWEPAIFAELASMGQWDEGLIVHSIKSGQFAFAITQGSRGTDIFDSRYTRAVADALDEAFPRQVIAHGLIFRLPANTSWSPEHRLP